MRNWFQSLLSKFNLYRYTKGSAKETWASHVGSADVPPEVARMAAAAAPVNPMLNAARAAARAKRAAMSKATEAATTTSDTNS